MNPDISSGIWDLPSPKRFIQKIVRALSEGISVLVIYPDFRIEDGLEETLIAELSDSHRTFTNLSLDIASNPEVIPFEFLRDVFPEILDCQYLDQIVMVQTIPDVLILKGLDTCPPKIQAQWLEGIVRWSEANRSQGTNKSLVMLLPAQTAIKAKLPPGDVRLAYHIWAGLPSTLEMRLLCRMLTDEISAESQWREYLISSLAGNDLDLCEWLWEDITAKSTDLLELTKDYAKNLGWKPEMNNGWFSSWHPKSPGVTLSLSPIDKSFSQLSRKITVYTPEYGEEIHPGILALQSKQSEFDHRIWRAQAALILPMIDDIRRRICDIMTSRCGPGWAVDDGQVLIPPIELSELKRVFNGKSNSSWEKRQWGAEIYQISSIRNQLAHYETITYNEFYQFWQLNSSVHRMINRNS